MGFAFLGGLGQSGVDPTTLLALGGGGLGGLGHGSPFDPTSVLALNGGLTGGIPGVDPNNGLLGDPSLLGIAGGMGGLAGPYTGDGIDPMILLAMNANGMGGGIDGLLSAGLGGDGAGLFGLMLGGEGMRDPSKGISNMLDAGIISQGDDVDDDGEPDHLVETRHKIDDYLAKQWLLGKRKLTVSVNYGNMPLEYQYLNQYHGFPVLCVLSTAPLLVHQALGLHRTDMVHPHLLFTLPLHLTNLHILSRSLIAFLFLSQSLISDCTRINYYKRKLH